MKTKDITLLIVVGIASTVFALAISSLLFSSHKNQQQKVEVVKAINPEFNTPSKTYFNEESINPTQNITIGNSDNQNPFKQAQ